VTVVSVPLHRENSENTKSSSDGHSFGTKQHYKRQLNAAMSATHSGHLSWYTFLYMLDKAVVTAATRLVRRDRKQNNAQHAQALYLPTCDFCSD
jgi:hypothetical protein